MKGLLGIPAMLLIIFATVAVAFAQGTPGDLTGDGEKRLADVVEALQASNEKDISDNAYLGDANTLDNYGVGVIEAVLDLQAIAFPKDEVYTNLRGMSFRLIPRGTFTMGSPVGEPERQPEEVAHQVTISNRYFIQTTEVKQADWVALMGSNPSVYAGDLNRPVENVSWEMVQEFLSRINQLEDRIKYRLPTEAEWEYAARAGSTGAFANGGITYPLTCSPLDPNLDVMGYYCGNASGTTHPVGEKTANAWGLYDMHGNVFEWCHDWHGLYPEVPVTDPTGPSTGSKRVLRGGDIMSFPAYCRSAYRWLSSPASSTAAISGFRLVLYTVHPDQYAVKNVLIDGEDQQATLTWDSKDNAISYNIYVHTKPGVSRKFYATKISDAQSPQVVTGLLNGTDYYFVVTAVTSEGETPESAEVNTMPQRPLTITNLVGMVFNLIDPGSFMMGSPADELGHSTNETLHEVILTRQFYMQTTEVTQDQWSDVMGGLFPNPSHFTGCGDCPVENVSWNDAQAFITELNKLDDRTYRLPTESEWEYTARAGSTDAFANGDIAYEYCTPLDPNLNAMGWYCGNSEVLSVKETHPVGLKAQNAWGLFDMHGNVFEWCSDRYSATYPTGPVVDPSGPGSGTQRVLRGGAYSSNAWDCRSAYRFSATPISKYPSVGFRVIMELRD